MKLYYIVNARIPTEKAHGFQIGKMCSEFAKAGSEVELWVPRRANDIGRDVFEFYGLERNFRIKKIFCLDFLRLPLFKKAAFYLQSFSFFLSLIFKKFDKDALIYTRNPELVWLFGLKGRKVIYDAHNWPQSKEKLFNFFLKRASAVICNSRGTEAEFEKNHFRTLVAPNGVDLEAFLIKEGEEELRKNFGLPLDRKIAMYVGHLYGWKGVDTIIEAAALSKDEKLLFVLVGGTEDDLKKYRKIIEERSLRNISLLGRKDKGLIPKFLKCADILLLPNSGKSKESKAYTSPIKMFEYLAAGKPIIASDLPSLREILDERNCFFVKPDSPDQLLERINFIVNNDRAADAAAKEALESAKEYSWEKRAGKILDFMDLL